MVFLRLSVKVYPRDQFPSSSSFSLRSILGDRDRENGSQPGSNSAALKPAGFLLILDDPEAVTLGGLAGMIQTKWRKLRPNVDPLEIKKLVDDNHPSVDLDHDMTVADVWVDRGKARTDGHDQHAAIRVIQKPAAHAPARFPSVEQDWDAAARSYEIKRQKEESASVHKFPAIPEEPSQESNVESTALDSRKGWLSLSVESDDFRPPPTLAEEEWRESFYGDPNNDNNATTVPPRDETRMQSQELGDFPVKAPADQHHQEFVSKESKDDKRKSESGSSYETSSEETDSETGSETSEENSETGKDTTSEAEGSELDGEESEEDESRHDHYEDAPTDDVAIPGKSPTSTEQAREADAEHSHVDQNPQSDIYPKTLLGKRKGMENEDLPVSKGPRLDFSSTSVSMDDEKNGSSEPKTDSNLGLISNSSSASKRSNVAVLSIGARDRREDKPGPSDSGLGEAIPERRNKLVTLSIPNKLARPDEAARRRSLIFGRHVSAQPTPKTPGKSSAQPSSSPPKTQNAAPEQGKSLPSALRKSVQDSQLSPRRFVSFADEQGFSLYSGPSVKSTPTGTNGRASPGTSVSSSASQQRRTSTVFPPGVPQEMVDKIQREAEEREERHTRQTTEYEQRIKDAEEQNASPEYIRQSRDILNTWTRLLQSQRSSSERSKKNGRILRDLLSQKERELKMIKPTVRNDSLDDGVATEKITTSNSATDGTASEKTGGQPVSPKEAYGGQTNGVGSTTRHGASSTPKETSRPKAVVLKAPSGAWTPSKEPRPQSAEQSTIGQNNLPQSSIKSEDEGLPSMSTIRDASQVNNQAKSTEQTGLPTPSEMATASPSDDLMSEESDSESDSESERESEAGGARQHDALPPPLRLSDKSPAPAWRPPPASDTRTPRASLKSLINDKKNANAAWTQQHAEPITLRARRKPIYSPLPDAEREESEETESDSDSDSESYADHGDIMSTGNVQKLRSPRQKKEMF